MTSIDSADADPHLEGLGKKFMAALQARRSHRIEDAMDLLRAVLKVDPRLPEPHLELAHIHLEAGRLEDAEVEAREGLRWLQQGGQWTDDLPENVVASMAHDLMGEILRRRADSDQVVFGDPEVFKKLVVEARGHFDLAQQLDPSNEHAGHHAFFLGLDGEE